MKTVKLATRPREEIIAELREEFGNAFPEAELRLYLQNKLARIQDRRESFQLQSRLEKKSINDQIPLWFVREMHEAGIMV